MEVLLLQSLRDFRIFNSNKIIWYQHKGRHVVQWYKSEDPLISTHNFSLLIFDKEAETYVEVKKASSINGAGKTTCPHVK